MEAQKAGVAKKKKEKKKKKKKTWESQQVKVRRPPNLKNMREGSAVCRPAWVLLMQLVKCVSVCLFACACVPTHNVRRGERREVKNGGDLSFWIERERHNVCMCFTYVCIHQKYVSQQKWTPARSHASWLMDIFSKHLGLWLIPGIDWPHNALWVG